MEPTPCEMETNNTQKNKKNPGWVKQTTGGHFIYGSNFYKVISRCSASEISFNFSSSF